MAVFFTFVFSILPLTLFSLPFPYYTILADTAERRMCIATLVCVLCASVCVRVSMYVCARENVKEAGNV